MTKYCVLDLETNGTTTYKRFCNQLDSKHSIQCGSYVFANKDVQIFRNKDWSPGVAVPAVVFSTTLLVGQNFKFDMLWFMGDSNFKVWLDDPNTKVWDTMTVQYLLDGQDSTSARNLDTLAIKYGGVVKDDRIKLMYEEGLQSKDIPPEMLVPYALADAKNTKLIFLRQFEEARRRNLLTLIKVYMRHYLAVTEIEYNGMFVALDLLMAKEKPLVDEINKLTEWLATNTSIENPGSAMQVATYIWGSAHDANGVRRSADEQALTQAAKELDSDDSKLEVIEKILLLRSKNKMLSTYINKIEYYQSKKRQNEVKSHVGLVPLVHPDGCLHSCYETAYTITGRLSSRNPNLQNLPKELLDVFTSRSPNGVIVEIDFSQLEVCVAAQLSGDGLLITEIENKIDFHRRNAAFLYDIPESKVTDDQRKMAKGLTFALFYGAHAKRMAVDKNITEDLAQRFIDGFYDKYVDFKKWHQSLEEQVRNNSFLTDQPLVLKDKTVSNDLQQKSYIEMPWGKRYTFYDKGVRTRRGEIFRYWPTTDIKNLPVQGTASDLVNMMVGRLWRALRRRRDKVLMVNEIHDSIILDVLQEEDAYDIAQEAKHILTDVQAAWAEDFGYHEWRVSIGVGAKIGKNWLLCKQSEEI